MDAFHDYALAHSPSAFVGEPPCPVILVWTNETSRPFPTGVSLVKRIGTNGCRGVCHESVVRLLRDQLPASIPFLDMRYAPDMHYLTIDGTCYPPGEAARRISSAFDVRIGSDPAKTPNHPDRIRDPFHVWSRSAFHGRKVFKIDLDVLFLAADARHIYSFVEVKRSNKPPVGQWRPFRQDLSNYLLCFAFSNAIGAHYFTVHHDRLSSRCMTDETRVDVFGHRSGSHATPDHRTFRRHRRSGRTASAKQVLRHLTP